MGKKKKKRQRTCFLFSYLKSVEQKIIHYMLIWASGLLSPLWKMKESWAFKKISASFVLTLWTSMSVQSLFPFSISFSPSSLSTYYKPFKRERAPHFLHHEQKSKSYYIRPFPSYHCVWKLHKKSHLCKLQKIPFLINEQTRNMKGFNSDTFHSNFQTQWALSFPILSLLFFTRTLTLLWWREKRESLQSRLHITAPFTFPYIFHVSSITNDLKGLTSLENRQAVPNCHPRSDECIIFRIFCYSTFRYCYYVKYGYTECPKKIPKLNCQIG